MITVQKRSGLVVALALSACVAGDGRGPKGRGEVEKRTSAVTSVNGLGPNGLSINGLAINGVNLNGINYNGINYNGVALNGINYNGLSFNGINYNGIFLNGINYNGINYNGVNYNGIGLNGVSLNGVNYNGINYNGVNYNGINYNGVNYNGVNYNGVNYNGVNYNGVNYNSLSLNGINYNGINYNELVFNGINYNGINYNGVNYNNISLNGINYNGINYNGVVMSAAEQVEFKKGYAHFVACALPAGQYANVTDFNGAALSYPGVNGLAPEWRTGPLPVSKEDAITQCAANRAAAAGESFSWLRDSFKSLFGHLVACALPSGTCIQKTDSTGTQNYCGVNGLDPQWANSPPDLTKSSVMAQCVLDRAEALNQSAWHEKVMTTGFKKVFQYMVQCALPEGESVTVTDENNQPWTLGGALGLAPEWKTGALSLVGQKRVSSCLAARSNARGKTVQLSLRTENMPIVSSVVERIHYSHHEGGFWGNLFSTTPYMKTCGVEGGGVSGRICTEAGGCGFTPTGKCQSQASFVRNPSELYYYHSVAAGSGKEEVMNTFLPLGNTVNTGGNMACQRRDDASRSLWCWGWNDSGGLGLGYESVAEPIGKQVIGMGGAPFLTDVLEAALGFGSGCARRPDGSVVCWGKNDAGQLGNGTLTDTLTPTPVSGLEDAVQIFMTDAMYVGGACALQANADVMCWGQHKSSLPVKVNIPPAIKVDMGEGHTCTLDNTGGLWCWGRNDYGQVGNGTFSADVTTPIRVPIPHVVDFDLGIHHTCAVTPDRKVKCWGNNWYGQLGDGTVAHRTAPVAVQNIAGVRSLGVTSMHSCASKWDGTTWCWGAGHYGQRGDGTYNTYTPGNVPVQTLLPARARILPSKGNNGNAILDGKLYAWGDGKFGQLGDGILGDPSAPSSDHVARHNVNTPVVMGQHSCGNGTCQPAAGETTDNCPADCTYSCALTASNLPDQGERMRVCGAPMITDATICGSHTETTGTSSCPEFVAGAEYKIVSKLHGKGLDVSSASTANGAQIIQYGYVGGANQKWKVVDLGGGYYHIVAVHSGKGLAVWGESLADGANIVQWDTGAWDNHIFQMIPRSGGFYAIAAKHSGKVISVDGASLSDGATLLQWQDYGYDHQQWSFVQVGGATCTPTQTTVTVAHACPNPAAAFNCTARHIACGKVPVCGDGFKDSNEACDGGDCCNANCTFKTAGTSCRAANGTCDNAEVCTGSSGVCPADGFKAAGTQCRASAGACDAAETCSGTTGACPNDAMAPAGTVCRAANGACDNAETCNGSSVTCPADVLKAAGTVCRAANGTCDNAEVCSGSSNACPADGFKAAGTSCRASAGACDVGETCSGTTGACPNDALAPAGTVCRASTGGCDVAETCSGSALTCPADTGSTCQNPYPLDVETANNAQGGAVNIATTGTVVPGIIGATGDIDWYKVSLPANKPLTVTVTVPAGKNYNAYLYNGTTLLKSGTAGAGLTETLTITKTSALRTITIKVVGATSTDYSSTASYTVKPVW